MSGKPTSSSNRGTPNPRDCDSVTASLASNASPRPSSPITSPPTSGGVPTVFTEFSKPTLDTTVVRSPIAGAGRADLGKQVENTTFLLHEILTCISMSNDDRYKDIRSKLEGQLYGLLSRYTNSVDSLLVAYAKEVRTDINKPGMLASHKENLASLVESLVRLSNDLPGTNSFYGNNHDHKSVVGMLLQTVNELIEKAGDNSVQADANAFLDTVLYGVDAEKQNGPGTLDLDMLANMFKHAKNPEGASIAIRVDGPSSVYTKDVALLWSTLYNFMTNAIKNPGTRLVSLKASDAAVTVTNNGQQIPGSIVEKLNSRFDGTAETFASGETSSGKGTEALVAKGAKMSCRQGDEAGAVFEVKYEPAVELKARDEEAAVERSAKEAAEAETAKRVVKVAVVDDESVNVRLASRCLKKPQRGLTFEVNTYKSGDEFLTGLREGKSFDIAFIDKMMPKMSGDELASKLTSDGRAFPLVMLSADAEPGSSRSNFVAQIKKPFNKEGLIDAIQAHAVKPEKTLTAQTVLREGVASAAAVVVSAVP